MAPVTDRTRLSLFSLTWPIWVENMLRTSFLSLDTLMLANYSEHAVAAMSLVHTVGFFVQLLYFMVGIGANILISQNLGANRTEQAGRVGVAGLVLILAFSALVSLALAIGADPLVGMFGLEPIVHQCAVAFIRIYSGFSIFLAINIVQANILRSWGHSRDSMVVNILTLGLTVVLCLLGLFGPFTFSAPGIFSAAGATSPIVAHPEVAVEGVTWVAGMTVAGQILACVIFAILMRYRTDVLLPIREFKRISRKTYKAILKIGVPTAGETLSYNVAQIVILGMVSQMGTHVLAAYGIIFSILRYVFMSGISIGSGAQIKVGYYTGAGRYDDAYHRVYRYFASGFAVTLVASLAMYAFADQLLALFTANTAITSLATTVLLVALFHEPGRTLNTIFIPALKGAGDAVFPALLGLCMMWCIGVASAWTLGVHFKMGLVGIWIGMATEEWLRGIIIVFRWRSKAWMSKTLVHD